MSDHELGQDYLTAVKERSALGEDYLKAVEGQEGAPVPAGEITTDEMAGILERLGIELPGPEKIYPTGAPGPSVSYPSFDYTKRKEAARSMFREMAPGARTKKHLERLNQAVDLSIVNMALQDYRKAKAKDPKLRDELMEQLAPEIEPGVSSGLITDPRKASEWLKAVEESESPENLLYGEMNTPDLLQVWSLGLLPEKMSLRAGVFVANAANDLMSTTTFGILDADTFFDIDETTQKVLMAERQTRGMGAKVIGGAIDLGAIVATGNIHAVGGLIAKGAMRAGMTQAAALRFGMAQALGILGAGTGGGVEGYLGGVTFGYLAPGIASAARRGLVRLEAMKGGDRLVAMATEAIGFAGAGAALHGLGDLEQLGVDAILGAVLGAASGRSGWIFRLKNAQDKYNNAKTDAQRKRASADYVKEWRRGAKKHAGKWRLIGGRRAEGKQGVPDVSRAPPEGRVEGEVRPGRAGADRAKPEDRPEAAPEAVAPQPEAGAPAPRGEGRGAPPEATVTVQEPAPLGDRTGLKKKVIIEEMGADPLMHEPSRRIPDIYNEAIEILSREPRRADTLMAEFDRDPRPFRPAEGLILMHRKSQIRSDLRDALEKGDTFNIERLESELGAINHAIRLSTKAWGEAGIITQLLTDKDFSMDNLILERQTSLGRKQMSVQEENVVEAMAAKFEKALQARDKLAKEVAELRKQEAGAKAAAGVREIVKAVHKERKKKLPPVTSPKFGATNKIVTREGLKAAQKVWNEEISGLKTGVPITPRAIAAASKAGIYVLEGGVRSFARFSRDMVKLLGEKIKPHLKVIYAESQKALSGAAKEEATEKIRARAEKGEDITSRELGELAVVLTRGGLLEGVPANKHRDVLTDAMHDIVRAEIPGITREQLQESFVDYGKATVPSQEPAKKIVRQVKQETLKVLQRRDIEAGEAAKKTGRVVDEPGAELREQTRLTTEAARKSGRSEHDPKRELVPPLVSIEKRLQREIDDIAGELRTGKPLPGKQQRTPVRTREETQRLKAELDELRRFRKEAFPKPKKPLTTEQRVQIVLRAIERSEARMAREVERGGEREARRGRDEKVEADERVIKARTELEKVKTERDEIRENLKLLSQRPPSRARTREERIHHARDKRLLKKEVALRQRVADKDVTPLYTKPETVPLTPKQVEAQARIEALERQWAEIKLRDHLKNRHWALKGFDALVLQPTFLVKGIWSSFDLSWFGRQGIVQTLGHPIETLLKGVPASVRALTSEAPPREGQGPVRHFLERLFNRRSKRTDLETAKMHADEIYPFAVRSGLEIVDPRGPLAKQAEEFQGRWSRHIPIVSATQRAFEVGGNVARLTRFKGLGVSPPKKFELFKSLLYGFSRNPRTPTLAEGRVYAHFINNTVGRPPLPRGKLGQLIAGLGVLMYAPRLAWSRFFVALGTPIYTPRGGYKGTLKARALIAAEFARFYMGMGVVMALAEWAGAKTPLGALWGDDPDNRTLDPGSTDFMQITTGEGEDKQAYDLSGGVKQAATLMYRLIAGEKTTGGGEVVSLRGDDVPYGGDTTWDELTRWFRKKESPMAGKLTDFLVGEDFMGRKTTAGRVFADLPVPLPIKDIYESMKAHGVAEGAARAFVAFIGVGVQTWLKEQDDGGDPVR